MAGGNLALAAEEAGGEGAADIKEAGEVGPGEGVGLKEMAQDIERAGGGGWGGLVIALPGFDEVAEEREVIGLVAVEAMAGEGVGDGDGFAVVGAVADGPGQQDIAAECAVFHGQASEGGSGGIVSHGIQATARAGQGRTRAAMVRDLARAAVSRS